MSIKEQIKKFQDKFPNPNFFIAREELEIALKATRKMRLNTNVPPLEIEEKYKEELKNFGEISFLGRSNLRENFLNMALNSFHITDAELWDILPAIEYTDTLILCYEYFDEPIQSLKEARQLKPLIKKMCDNAKTLNKLHITPSTEEIEKLTEKQKQKLLTKQKVWDTFLYLSCLAIDKNVTKESSPSKRVIEIVNHLLKAYFDWSHSEDDKQPYTKRVKIGEFILTPISFDDYDCDLVVFHTNKFNDKTKTFHNSYPSN